MSAASPKGRDKRGPPEAAVAGRPPYQAALRDASPYQVKRHECRFPEGADPAGAMAWPRKRFF